MAKGITDVFLLKPLDEIGDSLVLRDAGYSVCVEHGPIQNVFVGAAKQQHPGALHLHAQTAPHASTA